MACTLGCTAAAVCALARLLEMASFLLRRLPGRELLLRLLARQAIRLLDLARELRAPARDRVDLLGSQLPPVPQRVALEMLPVARNAIPLHRLSFAALRGAAR